MEPACEGSGLKTGSDDARDASAEGEDDPGVHRLDEDELGAGCGAGGGIRGVGGAIVAADDVAAVAIDGVGRRARRAVEMHDLDDLAIAGSGRQPDRDPSGAACLVIEQEVGCI